MPEDLEHGQFTQLQFSQGTDEADERINFSRGQRPHEFPFQTKLNRKRFVAGTGIPRLVQSPFQLSELHVREVGRQLSPNGGGIGGASRELCEHPLMDAEQLKRNRFLAQSQIVEKLVEGFAANVQLVGQ